MAKKTTFEQLKELDPQFANEIMKMPSDSMLQRLVSLLEDKEMLIEAQKKDPDIQSLSEELKTTKETYSIPKKAINLKVKYIIESLAAKKLIK